MGYAEEALVMFAAREQVLTAYLRCRRCEEKQPDVQNSRWTSCGGPAPNTTNHLNETATF